MTPSTFSAPRACAHSAITTAESTPPDRPTTARSIPALASSSRRKLTRSSLTSAGWTSSSLMLQRVLRAQGREERHVPREGGREDLRTLVAPQRQLAARPPQGGRIELGLDRPRD